MVGNVKRLLGVGVFGMGAVCEREFFLHSRNLLFAVCRTAGFGGPEGLRFVEGCDDGRGSVVEFRFVF